MKQDLKTRTPVAILYVMFIGTMTLLGQTTTALLLIVFFAFSIHEFVSNTNRKITFPAVMIYGISSLFIFLSVSSINQSIEILPLLVVSCFLFIVNIVYMILKGKILPNNSPVILSSMVYIVLPFVITLILTCKHEMFPKILLGSFIILWLNDAGAYFFGKAFGKNKLFPSISPKKTWEGFLGGGIAGLLISLLISPALQILDTKTWISLSLIIWIFGVFGDLVESAWKRHNNIKDSGTIMRGHGGFLDRLDSFIYAIPFVALYFILFINP